MEKIVTKKDNEFFDWSDAWVFTAIYFTNNGEKIIDLGEIIAAGDALNHAIFTVEELHAGFIKLQQRGIIQVNKDRVSFTELGNSIVEKAEKTRGGMFSRVDISLKKLNSSRNKLPFIKEIDDCSFITKENLLKSYHEYHKLFYKTKE